MFPDRISVNYMIYVCDEWDGRRRGERTERKWSADRIIGPFCGISRCVKCVKCVEFLK